MIVEESVIAEAPAIVAAQVNSAVVGVGIEADREAAAALLKASIAAAVPPRAPASAGVPAEEALGAAADPVAEVAEEVEEAEAAGNGAIPDLIIFGG